MKKNYLSKKRRGYIGLMKTLMGLCAGITCAVTLFIIIYVLCKGSAPCVVESAFHKAQLISATTSVFFPIF